MQPSASTLTRYAAIWRHQAVTTEAPKRYVKRLKAFLGWDKKKFNAATQDKALGALALGIRQRTAAEVSPIDMPTGFSRQRATGVADIKPPQLSLERSNPVVSRPPDDPHQLTIEKQIAKRVDKVNQAEAGGKITTSQSALLRHKAGLTEEQNIARSNFLAAIKSSGADSVQRQVSSDPDGRLVITSTRSKSADRNLFTHGTWSHGSGDFANDQSKSIAEIQRGNVGAQPVIASWSGGIHQTDRDKGGEQIARLIKDVRKLNPDSRINTHGHSHGGNVNVRAAELAGEQLGEAHMFGTPQMYRESVSNPEVYRNEHLTPGALAAHESVETHYNTRDFVQKSGASAGAKANDPGSVVVRREAHTELHTMKGRFYGSSIGPHPEHDGLAGDKITNRQHSAGLANPFDAHSKTMSLGAPDVSRPHLERHATKLQALVRGVKARHQIGGRPRSNAVTKK